MDTSENQNSHHIPAFPQFDPQRMLAHELLNQNNDNANIFQTHAVHFRRAIIHKDPKELIETAKKLRLELSASDRPPIEDFLETGLISHIVKLLDPDDKINFELQFELMWIISNACAGNEEQTSKIVTNHLIEKILRFIWHSEQKIVELALWVIANVSGDSYALRKKLLQFDVLGTIYKFTKKSKKRSIKENIEFISWILSNFTLITEAHEQFFEYGLLRVIEGFLCLDDRKTCSYACWAYSSLTERGDEKYIAPILTRRFLERIVKLLECNTVDILQPAVRTIGNILSSDSPYALKMYSAGCLDKLEALIQYRKPNIRKEVIWAISNMVSEPILVAEILERSLFSKLLHVIMVDTHSVKLEALYCFINALSIANQEQVETLVKLGLIKAFSNILSSKDKGIIMRGLEALECILISGSQTELPENPYIVMLYAEGIIDLVEELQHHPDNDVYQKVSRIIDTYLPLE